MKPGIAYATAAVKTSERGDPQTEGEIKLPLLPSQNWLESHTASQASRKRAI